MVLLTIERSRWTGAGGGCRHCQSMPARPSDASPAPITPSLSTLRSQSNRPWGRAHGGTPAVTSPTSSPGHACETARAALRRCAGVRSATDRRAPCVRPRTAPPAGAGGGESRRRSVSLATRRAAVRSESTSVSRCSRDRGVCPSHTLRLLDSDGYFGIGSREALRLAHWQASEGSRAREHSHVTVDALRVRDPELKST